MTSMILILNIIGWLLLIAGYTLPKFIYKGEYMHHKRSDLRTRLGILAFTVFCVALFLIYVK